MKIFLLLLCFSLILFFLNPTEVNASGNPDWKNIYSRFIGETKENESPYRLRIDRYTIFDIDNNGVPELICLCSEWVNSDGDSLDWDSLNQNSLDWDNIYWPDFERDNPDLVNFDIENSFRFYNIKDGDLVEIGKITVEGYKASIIRPAYPEKGYLILSDPDDYHEDAVFYRVNINDSEIRSEKIASVKLHYLYGKEGIYYPIQYHHPNEYVYKYTFNDLTETKESFVNKLSLGTPLKFLNFSFIDNYERELLFNTTILYTYPSEHLEDAPHSSSPELYYQPIFYDNLKILDDENEFTSLTLYPSGISELSVNSDSGTTFVMVNGTFISNCNAKNNDGTIMLPLRLVLEALGKNVVWNDTGNYIEVKGKNTNLEIKIGSTDALINGSAVVLEKPPVVIDGRTYIPASLFYEDLGISIDQVSNLRHPSDKANIIALENIYPESIEFIPETYFSELLLDIESKIKVLLLNKESELNAKYPNFEGSYPKFEGTPKSMSFQYILGRYYVYHSDYIDGKLLLVNKYTGEIYTVLGHTSGFPIYTIRSGVQERFELI